MKKSRKRRGGLLSSIMIGGAAGILLSVILLLINQVVSLKTQVDYLALENEKISQALLNAELKTQDEKEQKIEGETRVVESRAQGTIHLEKDSPQVVEKITEVSSQVLQTLDGVKAGTQVEPADLNMDDIDKYFQAYEIKPTGTVYGRINGRSYRENPNINLNELRYLKMLHYNFNHQLQVGELIVNVKISQDVLAIFKELFEAEYEIQSMHLVDNYWVGDGGASDSASIDENNTSAFNYRAVTGGKNLSNHAYGLAIDLNPQQNPYVSYRDGVAHWSHKNADAYINRDSGLAHVITHEDLAFRVFTRYGFIWGGDWNNPKDYQHFEKKLY